MRRSRCLSSAVATVALAVPQLLCGTATGAVSHPLLNAGQGIYEDACGLASHGGMYVSDYYRDSITGPSTILNEEPGDGPCKLAFDESGDLYVNNWHRNVVKYAPPFSTKVVIDASYSTGVAVDQATGHVFVVHKTSVAEYSAAGAFIQDIGATGDLVDAYGIAVSEYPATDGYLYVPDAASDTVKIFNPAIDVEHPVEEMNGVATPAGRFVYLVDSEVAVDNSPTSPSYGHVFVLDAIGHGKSEHPIAVFDEFNAQGDYRGQVSGFTDAEPSGIFIDPTVGINNGDVSVTTGNTEGSAIFRYGPTAPARTLNVTKTGAGEGIVTALPQGIHCGEACAAEYDKGQTVTLFAEPDGHSTFTGWTVTGSEPCPGTATCTVSLTEDVEVHADFAEPPQETLTVSVTGPGVVSSTPDGISCPGTCSGHFNQGRTVTLIAAPAPHQRIAGWGGCVVQANPAECKITMGGPAAVNVEFGPITQRTLTVQISGGGQGTVTSFPSGISCPSVCVAGFDENQKVILVAAPAPISSFGGFSGAGCSGTAPLCEVTMDTAKTVTATFAAAAAGTNSVGRAATLKIRTLWIGGNSATLSVRGPEPGTLYVGGTYIAEASRVLGRGDSVIRVMLNPRGRRARHRANHRSLRAMVVLGFQGDRRAISTSATREVLFRHGRKRIR